MWPHLLPQRVLADTPGGGYALLRETFDFDRPAKWGIRFKPLLKRRYCVDFGKPELLGTWGVSRISASLPTTPTCLELVTDEDGFLNQPPSRDKRFPVAVVGDSFVGITATSNWVHRIGEILSLPALNLGVPHWATAQEVHALREYAVPRAPRAVVLAYFGGNDLLDSVTYEKRLATGRSWRELAIQELRRSRGSLAAGALPVTALLVQEVRSWVADRVLGRSASPVYPLRLSVKGKVLNLVFYDPYISILGLPDSGISESRNLMLIRAQLRDAQQLCTSMGARFVIVYVPSKEQVYTPLVPPRVLDQRVLPHCLTLGLSDSGELVSGRERPAAEAILRHLDDQAEVIGRQATDMGASFLDLTPGFRERAQEGVELYNYVDTHWNGQGHELAAALVSSRLRKLGLAVGEEPD